MKRKLMLFTLLSVVLLSCSKDKDEVNIDYQQLILGTWNISAVQVDEGNTDDELAFLAEIVGVLVAQDCEAVTLIFNENGTLSTRNGANDIGINVNAGGTGLSIDCPDTFETETTTWSLEGDQLTVVDGDGVAQTSTIVLSENELIVAGEEIDEDRFMGSNVVFVK